VTYLDVVRRPPGFLRRAAIPAVGILVLAGLIDGFLVEPNRLVERSLTVPCPGLRAPVRIALFSDVGFIAVQRGRVDLPIALTKRECDRMTSLDPWGRLIRAKPEPGHLHAIGKTHLRVDRNVHAASPLKPSAERIAVSRP
jgi:hypothetical protein